MTRGAIERLRRECQLMILEAADDDYLWGLFDALVAEAEARVMAAPVAEEEADPRE